MPGTSAGAGGPDHRADREISNRYRSRNRSAGITMSAVSTGSPAHRCTRSMCRTGAPGGSASACRLRQERLPHGELLHDLVDLDADEGHSLNHAAAGQRPLLGQRDRRALGQPGRLVAGRELHRLAVGGEQVAGDGDERGGRARARVAGAEPAGDRGGRRDLLGLVLPADPVPGGRGASAAAGRRQQRAATAGPRAGRTRRARTASRGSAAGRGRGSGRPPAAGRRSPSPRAPRSVPRSPGRPARAWRPSRRRRSAR